MQYLHDDQQDTIGVDMLCVCGARLVAWVGSGQLRRMGTGAGGWVVPRWTRFVSRETVVAAAGCPADMTLPSITTKHTLLFHF